MYFKDFEHKVSDFPFRKVIKTNDFIKVQKMRPDPDIKMLAPISCDGAAYVCGTPETIATISRFQAGIYCVLTPISKRLTKFIRKFANTPLDKRNDDPRRFIALLGKDFDDLDHYTAYRFGHVDHELVADDAVTMSDFTDNDDFKFTSDQVDSLKNKLMNNDLPLPNIINVKDVENRLGC